MKTQYWVFLLVVLVVNSLACAAGLTDCYTKADTWADTLVRTRAKALELMKASSALPTLGPWYSTRPIEAENVTVNHFPDVRVDVTVESADPGLRWRQRGYEDGKVTDLRLRPGNVMYFFRTITVREAMQSEVFLSCDDAMEVWLNGKKTFSVNENHRIQADQHVVGLDLHEGENQFLMKVYNSVGGSGVYFSLKGTESSWNRSYEQLSRQLWQDFPVEMDWWMQGDRLVQGRLPEMSEGVRNYFKPVRDTALERQWIETVLGQLPAPDAAPLRKMLVSLSSADASVQDVRWLTLYTQACNQRRQQRLADVAANYPQILFIKRHPVQPSFFGYTEGQSDAQAESHFLPGSALCLMTFKGSRDIEVETLLDDPTGVIRDMDVSWDGQRILYAHKKSREDDYHLYEMNAQTRTIRQITSGKGVADYEGRYLPDGDIVFSSSRCVQTVDCWWTEVSNMYRCDKDGRYLRRLGFDQVHTLYPAVLNDGTLVYTRWDYNDRGQVFPQGLFQMNPDGTGQKQYYGNNSWFPTTTSHVRSIPGTSKVLAVLMGHHSWQAGKLALIDRNQGRQEDSGVQLVAPWRDNPLQDKIRKGEYRVDGYGQDEELFRHPWALNEDQYITAMTPDRNARGNGTPFMLYYVDKFGHREVLVADRDISCDHPIPLASRPQPPVKAAVVDYAKDSGTYFMEDVYVGPGLKDIPRGTAKKLRVVSLEYRAAGVGNNSSGGEAGGAMISTPISVGNGCWDVKKIWGETPIQADGSAFFRVPARTPVYFQVIDKQGSVVQTMRSWSTLMPGEHLSCIGCHEDEGVAPLNAKRTIAMQKGPQDLTPFYGPPRGFSFAREVQPILDQHCISCHDGSEGEDKAFSLTSRPYHDTTAKRFWSEAYLALTGSKPKEQAQGDSFRDVVNWIEAQSRPSMLPPYYKGSAKSTLMKSLREGHGKTRLDQEALDKIAAWIDLGVPFCGDYLEANAWNQAEMDKYMRYQRKREALALEDHENIERLFAEQYNATIEMPEPEPRYQEYLTAGPGLNAKRKQKTD
ncbi:MAG: hypothetical protein K9N55_10540 [Phycisphaerae bacterium]|nr:hypothetical protein [Phycisphaerae bacterium]